MKYGQPLLTTELSGKLGGVVGATARGGVGYFRRRVTGSNPMTPLQTAARAVMTTLSAMWKNTLTGSQRSSWTAKAPDEQSGIDVFIRGNFQQLLTATEVAATTAPATLALVVDPISSVGTFDVSDGELSIQLATGTDFSYAVYLTKPQSASRDARQFPYSFVATQEQGAVVIDLSAQQISGPLVGLTAGQVFYIRLVAFGTGTKKGQVAQAQEFRCVAVA